MLRPRIIPCLLIHEGGLVKTTAFKNPKYVGDPINAVKIFNEKEADELIVLDIDATARGTEPDYKTIAHLASESRMPLAYGGGVLSAKQAKRIISLGVEKVCVSAAAVARPALVGEMAEAIGSQSVVVVLDVKTRLLGGSEVVTHNASRGTGQSPLDMALQAEASGAGEVLLNSVDRDGTMKGYDLELARRLRAALKIPLTVLGGAGSLDDIARLIGTCGIVGAAAGSLFVFKGQYRAVLINYPQHTVKEALLREALRAAG